MRLSSPEEYGLRCLVQVARRSPGPEAAPTSIRDVAEAEGLSVDYAAKLLRALRQADVLVSARGSSGGYALARSPDDITLAAALSALDEPFWPEDACGAHAGNRETCVHAGACGVMGVWQWVGAAIDDVLARVTLADLLRGTPPPALPSRPRVEVRT